MFDPSALPCPRCLYDLRGAGEAERGVCSECGEAWTRYDLLLNCTNTKRRWRSRRMITLALPWAWMALAFSLMPTPATFYSAPSFVLGITILLYLISVAMAAKLGHDPKMRETCERQSIVVTSWVVTVAALNLLPVLLALAQAV